MGFYGYTDERAIDPGDMWVAGQSCWNRSGYSIGATGKYACCNIDFNGNICCPYNLTVDGNITAANANPF
jgi:hypothetical protein